jgi:hypothetical protein
MTMKTHTVMTDSGAPSNVENPNTTRDVRYRKGTVRRKDSLGDGTKPLFSSLANCDTRTGFVIDPTAGEYRSYKLTKFPPPSQLDEYRKQHPKDVVEIQARTVDTGERKEFFGQMARHLVTTVKRAADGNGIGGEETWDGWYIEHDRPDENCAPDYVRSDPNYVVGTALVMYPQIAHINHVGPLPGGLTVKMTMTQRMRSGNGNPDRTFRVESTVEELSDSPLNPNLFVLPAGLRENPNLLRGH